MNIIDLIKKLQRFGQSPCLPIMLQPQYNPISPYKLLVATCSFEVEAEATVDAALKAAGGLKRLNLTMVTWMK